MLVSSPYTLSDQASRSSRAKPPPSLVAPPPMPKACLRHDEGGGKTRHELAPPSCSARFRLRVPAELTHSWRVKVGVSVASFTPTRNAIGLSSLVGVQSADGVAS